MCTTVSHRMESVREYMNTIMTYATTGFLTLLMSTQRHNHLLKWKDVKILHSGLEKRMKTVEAAHITVGMKAVMNYREGFISLSQTTATLVISMIGQPTSSVNIFLGR